MGLGTVVYPGIFLISEVHRDHDLSQSHVESGAVAPCLFQAEVGAVAPSEIGAWLLPQNSDMERHLLYVLVFP